MAISTYKVFLMVGTDNGAGYDYEKLIDIKEFPDLGGEPELLETTTLSDRMQTFIAGIQTLEALSFTANYTREDFASLKSMEGLTQRYAVWFGGTGDGEELTPTGSEGKFYFDGQISVYPAGGGVNEVVNMGITIAPSTEIMFDDSISEDATLRSLVITGVTLSPSFTPGTTAYTAGTTNASNKITAVASNGGAAVAIAVGNTPVPNGGNASWSGGSNTLKVVVVAADGTTTKTYTVTVTKS